METCVLTPAGASQSRTNTIAESLPEGEATVCLMS
jgi:hypothetical protein